MLILMSGERQVTSPASKFHVSTLSRAMQHRAVNIQRRSLGNPPPSFPYTMLEEIRLSMVRSGSLGMHPPQPIMIERRYLETGYRCQLVI